MRARIKFRKYGVMKFIGHLDVMRYFQKVMRRADMPVAFTGGYSPHMIMSFAQPLGVGMTSDGEYLDVELTENVDPEEAVARMNREMAEGIEVVGFTEISGDRKAGGMAITAAAAYEVSVPISAASLEITGDIPETWSEALPGFLAQERIVVWKKSKNNEREVDIRPLIYEMRPEKDRIHLLLAAGSEQNLKPDLVMEAFLNYMGLPALPLAFHRTDLFARGADGALVPLSGTGTVFSFFDCSSAGNKVI